MQIPATPQLYWFAHPPCPVLLIFYLLIQPATAQQPPKASVRSDLPLYAKIQYTGDWILLAYQSRLPPGWQIDIKGDALLITDTAGAGIRFYCRERGGNEIYDKTYVYTTRLVIKRDNFTNIITPDPSGNRPADTITLRAMYEYITRQEFPAFDPARPTLGTVSICGRLRRRREKGRQVFFMIISDGKTSTRHIRLSGDKGFDSSSYRKYRNQYCCLKGVWVNTRNPETVNETVLLPVAIFPSQKN